MELAIDGHEKELKTVPAASASFQPARQGSAEMSGFYFIVRNNSNNGEVPYDRNNLIYA